MHYLYDRGNTFLFNWIKESITGSNVYEVRRERSGEIYFSSDKTSANHNIHFYGYNLPNDLKSC